MKKIVAFSTLISIGLLMVFAPYFFKKIAPYLIIFGLLSFSIAIYKMLNHKKF
jgi:hypothetical protein